MATSKESTMKKINNCENLYHQDLHKTFIYPIAFLVLSCLRFDLGLLLSTSCPVCVPSCLRLVKLMSGLILFWSFLLRVLSSLCLVLVAPCIAASCLFCVLSCLHIILPASRLVCVSSNLCLVKSSSCLQGILSCLRLLKLMSG